MKPETDGKATLLLSHHQYFTAFSGQSNHTKPAKQLSELFEDQEVVWIWGHEHRLAIYDKFATDGALTAYGRCLGHSGMPADTGAPTKSAPVRFYDQRTHQLEDGAVVGENGYLLLTVAGESLTLDHRDIRDTQLFVETFRTAADGKLRYSFEDKEILTAVVR